MSRFAEVLTSAFLDPKFMRQARRCSTDIGYTIGDGTPVCLNDFVSIPAGQHGSRGGERGRVIKLDKDGLGLRFERAEAGIRREFWDWRELDGATVSGIDRKHTRKSVTPPPTKTVKR